MTPASNTLDIASLQTVWQNPHLAEELGGQSIVSTILNGKRELNTRQVKALAKRFNVSAAVFL